MTADESSRDAAALAAYLDPDRAPGERQAAFSEIVGRHAHRLHAVCLRVLGSHADAEEAVQETFVRLARSGGGFRGDAALSTWLFRVARNVCTDRVRHDARRPSTPVADVTTAVDAPDPDERSAELRAELGDVGRALRGLDDTSRTLLLLVAVDGLSYADAAAATGIAVGTVKSRVSRARLQLGELLADPPAPGAGAPASVRSPGTPDGPDGPGARGPP